MFNCSRCVKRLSEYIDGTLGAREAMRLREHLENCASCREEHEALLATREALRTAPAPAARPGFWQHIELTLRTHSASTARRFPLSPALRGWAWGATAVLLLLLGGTLYFAHAPTSQPVGKMVVAQRSVNDAVGPISMDALVSLHAQHSAARPLSDAGRLRYLGSVSEQADLQYDGKLDIH